MHKLVVLSLSLLMFASISWAGPIEDMPANTWYEVPNSKLSESGEDPCPNPGAYACNWSGNSGLDGVMDGWNGAAWDEHRNRMIVWGGGHWVYGGNELYVFDLDTLAWERLTDPSPNTDILGGNTSRSGQYVDGLPSARHTYNHIQYLAPPIDRFISMGGCCDFDNNEGLPGGANGTSKVQSYHFGEGTGPIGWDSTSVDEFSSGGGSTGTGMASAVDGNNVMWALRDQGGGLWRLDLEDGVDFNQGDNKFTFSRGASTILDTTAAIDTARNQMVAVGRYGNTSRIKVFDLNTNAAGTTPPTTGDKTIEDTQASGFVYDSYSDKFVGWSNDEFVYTLDPVTWVWEKIAPAAGNTVVPTDANDTGTYGRFRYSETYNVFVLVNEHSESVYLYRLGEGTGGPSAPFVSFSANDTTLTVGDDVTLTWSSNNANSCAASGDWLGNKATSGSQTIQNLTSDQSYTLTCTGDGGDTARTVDVDVTSPSAPSVALMASPTVITENGTTTLSWSVSNADSCSGSGPDFTGAKSASGGTEDIALASTGNYTFSLSCTGPGGSDSDSAMVTVDSNPPPAPPTVSLTANPQTVAPNNSSQLSWVVTNANSCTASGAWTGIRSANGGTEPTEVFTQSGTSSYSLSCTGTGGTTQDSVIVTVSRGTQDPTVNLVIEPLSVVSGGSVLVRWSSTDTTSCETSGGVAGFANNSAPTLNLLGTSYTMTADTTFTISCLGTTGKSTSDSETVVVTQPDDDTDNDGLDDDWEQQYFGNLSQGPNDNPDGDSYNNAAEFANGTNPTIADNNPEDTDNDGLQDDWEESYYSTITAFDGSDDPDNDGHDNEAEETANSNPLDQSSVPDDIDGDGMSDAAELQYFGDLTTSDGSQDQDNDGISDAAEMIAGTDPTVANVETTGEDSGGGVIGIWSLFFGMLMFISARRRARPLDAQSIHTMQIL